MPAMDALMHAFSIMGLGGFSSHDDSFGFFNSPAMEAVAIFFMLLAGINFATHFLFVTRRSFRVYRFDLEAQAFWWLMLGGVLLVAYFLWRENTYAEFLTALRFAAFNVVSIATTTGLATTTEAVEVGPLEVVSTNYRQSVSVADSFTLRFGADGRPLTVLIDKATQVQSTIVDQQPVSSLAIISATGTYGSNTKRPQISMGSADNKATSLYNPGTNPAAKDGDIFLADTGNNRVQRFDPKGVGQQVWGAEPDVANAWFGNTRAWYASGAKPAPEGSQSAVLPPASV
jgi:hypothetical protein